MGLQIQPRGWSHDGANWQPTTAVAVRACNALVPRVVASMVYSRLTPILDASGPFSASSSAAWTVMRRMQG